MKWKKGATILAAALCLIGAGSFTASAAVPYDTYTYSYTGKAQLSAHLYVPDQEISLFGELGTLNNPTDIVADSQGRLIIADRGNNRIVVVDQDFQPVCSISEFYRSDGTVDSLKGPQGVFATEDELYVADTENVRIVVFDQNFNFKRIIAAPDSDLLPENFTFRPVAVGVDYAGRISVVSENTNMGIIIMDKFGVFKGFLGAQRVEASAIELFRRLFMSEAQIERSSSFVPLEFSNLTVDDKGFVYVTASSINRYSLYSSIQSRTKSSAYAPVRKLNPSGTDVLWRNGFFPPVGDINFDPYDSGSSSDTSVEPSKIEEICLLSNDMYVLVDGNYNKLFLYDSSGNLLGAFGGSGVSAGLFSQLASVAQIDDRLYALDAVRGSITVFDKTDYAALIEQAIQYQAERNYDAVTAVWEQVITENGNFDVAYVGIGKALMGQGDYRQAMYYFQLAGDTDNYSQAFEGYRSEFYKQYGLLVFISIAVVVMAVMWFFHWVKKKNMRLLASGEKTGLIGELLFAFRVIFHPFKGFDELKNEKRGSPRSALILLAFTCVGYAFYKLAPGYLFGGAEAGSLSTALAGILLPVGLWCVSSWCYTSLMDGKGTMSDILVCTSYSLVPLAMLFIPVTILSHFLILDEASVLSLILGLGSFWTGFLLFFGTLTTHEYTLGKTIAVSVLTVAGIAFILFLMLIFVNLTGNIVTFIQRVVQEIQFRV